MDMTDLAWAAGLFEGEGCLTISHGTNRSGKRYAQARAKLSMTDEDVVRRFHEVIGLGRVREEDYYVKRSGYKKQYQWHASSKKDVKTFIELLMPFFFGRRRARALEVLEAC